MRRQWAALPLGELHAQETCFVCGSRGVYPDLKRVVVLSTHAQAVRCADMIACQRRRREGRL